MLDIFDALDDTELLPHLNAVAYCGFTLLSLDRFRDATGVLERGLAVAREASAVAWSGPMLTILAVVRIWQGRLETAAELLDDAIEAATLTGNDIARLW